MRKMGCYEENKKPAFGGQAFLLTMSKPAVKARAPIEPTNMKRLAIVVFLLPLTLASLRSQQQGSLSGTVFGEVRNFATKEPIPFANVLIVGTTIGAASNEQGRFEIRNVPVGTYAVRASVLGFQSIIRSDIVVDVARPVELNFDLTETTLELEEISVIADYFQKLPETPLSTQYQSSEEIRRLPGGLEDVVRAISILPGVAQVEPGRNDLIVRGGAPSENLYVVDNIEVPNINHFGTQGASGGPLSYVNLDFVESTSFSTGGFGVRYGDKLSSVLRINLRDGRTDHLGGKATISASQFGLNVEGPVEEKGSFIFSARRSYLDFIFKAAGFGFVPEYWDFFGKFHYHLGQHDRLNIIALAALDNVRFFNDTDDKRSDNSRIMGSDQNQLVGGISWQHLFPSGYATLSLGQSAVTYDYRQADSLLQPIFSSTSLEHESSLRADVVWQVSKSTELALGAQGKLIRFHSTIDLPPFWTNFGQQISVNADYDTTALKGSAYVQGTHRLGHVTLTAGLRADAFNLIEDGFALSPRVSASYAFGAETSLNASVGIYYQAPSLIWLTSHNENRRLKYIGTDQIVVGIDHRVRPDTKASLEVYQKKYFHYAASLDRPFLILANTGAGFGGSDDGYASFGLDRLASLGTGEARGAEFLVQKKLSNIPFYGTFSVSYNVSDFKAIDGIVRPNSFDQTWILNAGGGYIFSHFWEISAKFRYATGRPYTPIGPLGAQSAALYNSARIRPNHSLDIRVDRRWLFETWTLVTYIDIQNIYNRKPVTIPRYDVRTGTLDESNAIGILPSVGISAEF
jgi:hypothetical protein